MKFYLCATYRKKEKMKSVRETLQTLGHEVVSSWLDEKYNPKVSIDDVPDEELMSLSDRDMKDILEADALVHFQCGLNERGGALVEYGISLGLRLYGRDMATILVGEKRNIFDFSESVQYFPTVLAFYEWANVTACEEREAKNHFPDATKKVDTKMGSVDTEMVSFPHKEYVKSFMANVSPGLAELWNKEVEYYEQCRRKDLATSAFNPIEKIAIERCEEDIKNNRLLTIDEVFDPLLSSSEPQMVSKLKVTSESTTPLKATIRCIHCCASIGPESNDGTTAIFSATCPNCGKFIYSAKLEYKDFKKMYGAGLAPKPMKIDGFKFPGIGVSGKARSGKDTLVRMLLERLGSGWRREAFADALKVEWVKARHPFQGSCLSDANLVEVVNELKQEIPTIRQALIDLGQRRRAEDPDYWIKRVNLQSGCIIPDVRFKNEYDFLKAKGFLMVRIECSAETLTARGCPPIDDISETDLDDPTIQWNLTVANSRGIEVLETAVDEIAQSVTK